MYIAHELTGLHKEFIGLCASKMLSNGITCIVGFDKDFAKISEVVTVKKGGVKNTFTFLIVFSNSFCTSVLVG